MNESYKDVPFEKRVELSQRIRSKYPRYVPVIVDRRDKNSPAISKHKFLIPHDVSVSKLMVTIRNHIDIKPEMAIFLTVVSLTKGLKSNGIMPTGSAYIGDIYDKHKDADGFLYIVYSLENVFG
jgi:GABA(A) receptor-associated protein